MKAFSALLLAFPFYLAMHGRLAAYIALAKPNGGNAVASGAATPVANNAAGVAAANAATQAGTVTDLSLFVYDLTGLQFMGL